MLNHKLQAINILWLMYITMGLVISGLIILSPSDCRGDSVLNTHELDCYMDVELLTTDGRFMFPDTQDAHKDIDIQELQSWKEGSGTITDPYELVLSITVRGTIRNSDYFIYFFAIATNTGDYVIFYRNGVCDGIELQTNQHFKPPPEATVSGSTLTVRTKLSNIGGEPSTFKWNAVGIGTTTTMDRYIDLAPSKLVKILKPWNDATLHDTLMLEGVSWKTVRDITAVEINIIDDTGESKTQGWQRVGNYDLTTGSWSYGPIDTTDWVDGIYRIDARGYDGQDYFIDSITITIDHSIGTSPESTDIRPTVNVGDECEYRSVGRSKVICVDMFSENMMKLKIKPQEDIEVFGTKIKCWRVHTIQEGSMILAEYKLNTHSEIDTWFTVDELATLKEASVTEITAVTSNGGSHVTEPITTTTTTLYNPGKTRYAFPIEVGKHWALTTEATVNTETISGSTIITDSYVDDLRIEFECLKTVTITVPYGSYHTFAIRSQVDNECYYKIEYYAPELGMPVKIEMYNRDDLLISALGLRHFGHAPFITIEAIDWSPIEPRCNTKIEFTVRLRNDGKADTTTGKIELKHEASTLDSISLDIDAESTEKITLSWTPERDGEYNLTVVVTYDGDTVTRSISIYVAEAIGEPAPVFTITPSTLLIIVIIAVICCIILAVYVRWRRSKIEVEEEKEEVVAVEEEEEEGEYEGEIDEEAEEEDEDEEE
jgi:hypothetical protein